VLVNKSYSPFLEVHLFSSETYIMPSNKLLERLANGGTLIAAEGYVFEFERRGYLRAGCFVPEVVVEHPQLVRQLTEEFAHAGSEVALAFTYYGHRKKLSVIGRTDILEKMNREALKIAKEVADETGTLSAGNICNTTLFQADKPETWKECEQIFKEQIEWIVESGVDFIVGETFTELGEAKLAMECINKYGKGIPAVMMFNPTGREVSRDPVGVRWGECCRVMEEMGAAVVGLNCGRGPATIMHTMKEIRAACKGPIACLPVTYRTNETYPTMESIIDPETGKRAFHWDLPAHLCTRTEIENWTKECKEMGIQYIGLCCGNASHYTRIVSEIYGKHCPASKYSPNMSQHYIFGDADVTPEYFRKMYRETNCNPEVLKAQ